MFTLQTSLMKFISIKSEIGFQSLLRLIYIPRPASSLSIFLLNNQIWSRMMAQSLLLTTSVGLQTTSNDRLWHLHLKNIYYVCSIIKIIHAPCSHLSLEEGLTCLCLETLPSSLAEFLLAQNINIYDIKISILYKLYETQFGFIMISCSSCC